MSRQGAGHAGDAGSARGAGSWRDVGSAQAAGSAGDAGSAQDELARRFDRERPRLTRLAYSTTGSIAEAEDCVQEAWIRLQRRDDADQIRNLDAWLTTTVGRLALDALDRSSVRRETYVGPWLPEPIVEDPAAGDPADRVTLDESVSMALLVVLERLSAAERTAFVLHDVFGLPFEEVAGVVGRSPAAVRQLASRARRQVRGGRPRFEATAEEQRRIVEAFAAACLSGDLEALVGMLDPAVVWRGDGGGRVPASRVIQHGAERIARAMTGFAGPELPAKLVTVNGAPGILMRDVNGVVTVVSFTIDSGRIIALDVMRNPDKLGGVHPEI